MKYMWDNGEEIPDIVIIGMFEKGYLMYKEGTNEIVMSPLGQYVADQMRRVSNVSDIDL